MQSPDPRPLEVRTLWSLPIYLLLVLAYVMVVLRFLADPLKDLHDFGRIGYGVTCLILVVGQAVALEAVASWLAAVLLRHPRKR